MASLNTKIVGLKHKGIDRAFVENVIASRIKLVAEPTNRHDKHAVMCVFDGIHFGYIEKEKSLVVSEIIRTTPNYEISIGEKDGFKIEITVNFESDCDDFRFEALSNGDKPGIYEISFNFNTFNLKYIGQSVNINARLRQHYRELSRLSHYNNTMQQAWIKDKQSFKSRVIDSVPLGLSPLHQQILLFELEIRHIELAGNQSVNALAGDLVFTTDSLAEFDDLILLLKKQIRNRRKVLAYQKETICDLILDVGILRRHKISGNEIKSSNVLTWINKVRHSPFDYIPPINRSHYLYGPLVDALKTQQRQIVECDEHKKYVDSFKSSLIGNKTKYQTCEMKSLQKFLKILGMYKSVKDADIVIAQFHPVKRGSITYDSCLNQILDAKTISIIET